jgi:hypothetical protein
VLDRRSLLPFWDFYSIVTVVILFEIFFCWERERERISFIGQLWIWFSVTDLNERNKISSPVDVKEKEQLVTDIKYSKSHLLFPHHWLLPLERFFLSLSFTFSPFFSLFSFSLSLCVAYFFFLLLCLFFFFRVSRTRKRLRIHYWLFQRSTVLLSVFCNCTSKVNSSHSCYCVPRPLLNYAHVV